MNNGDDLGTVLWVSGCEHCCKECQNPITWNPDNGILFTKAEYDEFFNYISKEFIHRVTFSGGDPLYPTNREEIGSLIRKIKEKWPEKKIWIYTGYTLVDTFKFMSKNGTCFEFPELKLVDIVVDGTFNCEQRKEDIAAGTFVPWRGSSNQRVIDVQKTLCEGKIFIREYDRTGNVTIKED